MKLLTDPKSAMLEAAHCHHVNKSTFAPVKKNSVQAGQARASVTLPEAPWSNRHLGVYYATPGFQWVPLSVLPH